MRLRTGLTLAAAALLALSACAPVEETAADGDDLPTVTPGTLTVATSDPAYEPWVVDNDPTSGEGFESAVAYAVAEQLGFAPEDVAWTFVTFEQIIAPGAKSFDFAINQVSITEERSQTLDFSSSYYDTAQAVVTLADNPYASATSIAELADARLGAAVGTTSLQVIADVLAPSQEPQVYNDNDQAKLALEGGLVDALVFDLPTALYITAVELEDGVLVGQLPAGDSPDQFGLVLDKDSRLTEPVTAAVDALRADGTLARIEADWLTDAAGAPVLN